MPFRNKRVRRDTWRTGHVKFFMTVAFILAAFVVVMVAVLFIAS